MAKFLLLGRYSLQAVKEISGARTKKAVALIKRCKGRVNSMYALLGNYDLALLVDFPGIAEAMQASVGLTKMSGISFTTFPAMSVEEFDKIVK
ncbi:MAG: GYD domain-containing protein [Candidatus Omnitrophica bacterium]|nr:GYD domain-containing protein [Candidatus Omnitrophota bacterium]